MKKTLYQILGVDPGASLPEIEAAYNARIDELKFATIQDPNKLRVLQQSKAMLVDPARPATYAASISSTGPPAGDAGAEDGDGFGRGDGRGGFFRDPKGSHERRSGAGHGDDHRKVVTVSTSVATFSSLARGVMPWPRLKMGPVGPRIGSGDRVVSGR